MNDREVGELLACASQWWPSWRHPESTETMIRAWVLLLRDVTAAAATAALAEHATSGSEFPPPVGVVRRRAVELANQAGKAPAVDEAWGEVQDQIRHVGTTVLYDRGAGEATFTHPAIERVVTAMGWLDLCQSENPVADRAHFARLYSEAVESSRNRAAMPPGMIAAALSAAKKQTALEAGT